MSNAMPRPSLPSALSAVVLAASLAVPLPALAQAASGFPLWELGVVGVGVSQQAYPGASERVQQALVLPYLVYRGEFLRVDRGSAGVRAINTPAFEVDIGFAGSLGSRANDISVRRGMADLGTVVEFGPRLRWNLTQGAGPDKWRVDLPLRGVFDLSNGLAQRGVAFEPELVFSHREPEGLNYSAGVSTVLGSQSLAETFYGVTAAEATASRPAYAAQSGLIGWRLSGSVSRQVAPGVRLLAFGRIDSVAGAANQSSPLVQQTSGVSAGMVLTYSWRQSAERAVD
ncbi:MAG: MipA/OmpV family protein [Betaproteobacteria bacterium]